MNALVKHTLRKVAAMALGSVIGTYLQDPRYIWLAPLASALGKAIRIRWPQTDSWLPL